MKKYYATFTNAKTGHQIEIGEYSISDIINAQKTMIKNGQITLDYLLMIREVEI